MAGAMCGGESRGGAPCRAACSRSPSTPPVASRARFLPRCPAPSSSPAIISTLSTASPLPALHAC
eukprot:7283892-Pyramimonas_sp.AAC.1